MPKHHKKHDGEGFKLIGNPEQLVELMITDVNEKAWAVEEILDGGPKHKQVFNALLLMRVMKMIQTVEKSTESSFCLQKGHTIVKDKKDEEVTLPVVLPINLGPKTNKKKIVEAVSHAPEHEALAYTMCIQAIEWVIKATSKEPV